MEKRFAYKFLKKLLKYVDSAQEFIAHLGMDNITYDLNTRELEQSCYSLLNVYLYVLNPEAMAASGKTDRSPHEQEIKFFAKVSMCYKYSCCIYIYKQLF